MGTGDSLDDAIRVAEFHVFILVETDANHQVSNRELGRGIPVMPSGVAGQSDHAGKERRRDRARGRGDDPLPLQLGVDYGSPSGVPSMMCAVFQGGVLLAAAIAGTNLCPTETPMMVVARGENADFPSGFLVRT